MTSLVVLAEHSSLYSVSRKILPLDVFWNLFFSDWKFLSVIYVHILRSKLRQATSTKLCHPGLNSALQQMWDDLPQTFANVWTHAFRPAVDILNIRYELFKKYFDWILLTVSPTVMSSNLCFNPLFNVLCQIVKVNNKVVVKCVNSLGNIA